MIKKYVLYNESVIDEMKPKSDKDIKYAIDKLLSNIKKESNNPNGHIETFFYYLRHMYSNTKELLIDLIDNNILSAEDILSTISEDIDFPEEENKRNTNYKLRVMKQMYELIEKNIENLDINEIETF